MYSGKKGKSKSIHPPAKVSPEWVMPSKEEVENQVVQMGREGKGPSEIGRVLRDQYGVPSVKNLCGKSVLEMLRENKLVGDYPEDLMNLMRKAVSLRRHIGANKRDLHNTRSLALTEAKIRKLVSYYRDEGVLPAAWFYDPDKAALIVKE